MELRRIISRSDDDYDIKRIWEVVVLSDHGSNLTLDEVSRNSIAVPLTDGDPNSDFLRFVGAVMDNEMWRFEIGGSPDDFIKLLMF